MNAPINAPINAPMNALKYYVKECTLSSMFGFKSVEQHIRDLLELQTPLRDSMIVWRGQSADRNQIVPFRWFSTAYSRHPATGFMSEAEKCCLFKIHVQPGIRVINVHSMLDACGKSVNSKRDEEEWIIEGGGVFYQDYSKTKPGFRRISEGTFETYYFPQTKSKSKTRKSPKHRSPTTSVTVDTLMDRLLEEELFLYEGSNFKETRDTLRNLVKNGENVSENTLRNLHNRIQKKLGTK